MRHGNITTGILSNFYLNEVVSDISQLPVGSTLSCSKVNIPGYADDLVIAASIAQARNFMLISLNYKLYTLSLQVNVQR